jgi:carbon storage regulator
MLVLSRKVDERIVISGGIEIKVLQIRGNNVRLGVTAPDHVSVHRFEVQKKVEHGNSEQPCVSRDLLEART